LLLTLFSRPYLEKNPSQKRAGGVSHSVSPEFKPQCRLKKKKKEKTSAWYIIQSSPGIHQGLTPRPPQVPESKILKFLLEDGAVFA
jgi:hypothetical protein